MVLGGRGQVVRGGVQEGITVQRLQSEEEEQPQARGGAAVAAELEGPEKFNGWRESEMPLEKELNDWARGLNEGVERGGRQQGAKRAAETVPRVSAVSSHGLAKKT